MPSSQDRAAQPGPHHDHLTEQITELETLIQPVVEAINPRLLELNGVGADVAGQLLQTPLGPHNPSTLSRRPQLFDRSPIRINIHRRPSSHGAQTEQDPP
jgi:hypothetical protein